MKERERDGEGENRKRWSDWGRDGVKERERDGERKERDGQIRGEIERKN